MKRRFGFFNFFVLCWIFLRFFRFCKLFCCGVGVDLVFFDVRKFCIGYWVECLWKEVVMRSGFVCNFF